MAGLLTSDVADKLLDKLATDDNFRDLFAKDPGAALKQVGHTGDSTCMHCKKLASKDQVAKSRDALRTMLTTKSMSQTPIQLDAS